MGTNERRTASRTDRNTKTTADPEELPPRRWGRALAWLALIGTLVVVAVTVSFAADDRASDVDEPPFDQATFCLTAARFGSVSELDFSTTGVDELRNLRTVTLQLATLSPRSVADDLKAVGEALQRAADTVQAIPPNDPAGLAVITGTLDTELGAVSEQAARAAAYIERWCGPRRSHTVPVTPTDATGGPAHEPEPDVPSEPAD